MTIREETIACPCCGNSLERRYIGSSYLSTYFTDFGCEGSCSNTPISTICDHCGYLFYDETLHFDSKALTNYLQSKEYKDIFKEKHESNPFLVVYYIYRNLNFSLYEQSEPLLFNYYASLELEDFKLLYEHYELLIHSEELKNNHPEVHHIYKMIGEYNRRIGNFEKAKEIFLSLKEIKTVEFDSDEKEDVQKYFQRNIEFCDFQLELISELNDERDFVCLKQDNLPEYGSTYVLDVDVDKNLSDFENLSQYVEDVYHNKRYDDFFQGLEKLKNNNIDLYASNEHQQTLLHLTVELFTWRVYCDRDCKKILELFEALVFEFGFDPTLFYCDEYDQYVPIMKVICDNSKNFNKSRGTKYIEKTQEIYYKYALQIANQNKIKDLLLEKQHHLLTSQFPYYEKVSNLLKLGFSFDKNYEIGKDELDTKELLIPHKRYEYRIIYNMMKDYNYVWDWENKDYLETTHDMFVFLVKLLCPNRDKIIFGKINKCKYD